jgi:hypothetical protein
LLPELGSQRRDVPTNPYPLDGAKMKTYTQEEFKVEYTRIDLNEIQNWRYDTIQISYRGFCNCASWIRNTQFEVEVYGNEFKVYENCSNCLGKMFPPIPWTELSET